ncbi:unnamed protein product, partial [Ectocarpus sp. 12 AP-2014]
WASSYVQTADIDLTGVTCTPIGSSADAFTGVYDGSNLKISNWSFSGSVQYMGVFGLVSGGTLKNIELSGVCTISNTFSPDGITGFLTGCVNASSDVYNINSSFEEDTTLSSSSSALGGLIGWCTSSTL